MRLPIQARDITAGLLKAHQTVNVFGLGKAAVDQLMRCCRREAVHAHGHKRSEQRLTALNSRSGARHRW
jgi:hypothetical protein